MYGINLKYRFPMLCAMVGSVSCQALTRLANGPVRAVRGALLNSGERRAARRKRRDEKRACRRAERLESCTMERVADLNALHVAAKQAARGVSWKSSIQRYMKNELRNIVRTRHDLLEGNDMHRGFVHFSLYERGKLRHISSVHASERVPQKSLAQNQEIGRAHV